MSEATWYLRTQDETFGPETAARLVEWAKMGRIQPGQEVSADGDVWQRVEDVPFLDLRFSIDLGDGVHFSAMRKSRNSIFQIHLRK